MTNAIKKISIITSVSIVITLLVLAVSSLLPLNDTLNRSLYDRLAKEKCRLVKPPAEIAGITLVLIDNNTLNKMQSRWPYPRSDFATVIDNIEKAGAKAIAFDFTFMGQSTPEEDALLKNSIEKNSNLILACTVDERGILDFCPGSANNLAKDTPLGIVTKLQDDDGVSRSALTYLVNTDDPKKGFLSWEIQLLKTAKAVSMDSFSNETDRVTFKDGEGKAWSIPVNPKTKSFMINFTAHTTDFKYLSFYNVLKGDFGPAVLKDKIVMVGLASSILADIHNTPIGWIPGITLNANSFLTLYSRNFLTDLPPLFVYILTILAVILASLITMKYGNKAGYIFIAAEVALFFLLSYLLLTMGYLWNYSGLPLAVIICPIITKKILGLTYHDLYV
ncbi:MAG: CHASE2 domain-containing protein [Candidatus Omnitrophica bacterium]|nr:CHASE2 domain-containing protein [Candidatus Omnitrophota bacterium]